MFVRTNARPKRNLKSPGKPLGELCAARQSDKIFSVMRNISVSETELIVLSAG